MRDTMKQILHEVAAADPNFIAVIDDTGFQIYEEFQEKYPTQFYNVGIAEQQFIGFAAGLALEGMKPVLYNVCNFYIRAFEQIRNDIAYQNLGVVMIGVGGGLYYGTQGPTHHGTEDISLFRSLPNMTVCCPADPIEMRAIMLEAIQSDLPAYIRICKNNDPLLHSKNKSIKIGKSEIMLDGGDAAIIATGGMVREALATAKLLKEKGISVRVVSMHTVKPLDMDMIAQCTKFPALYTMEENTVIGGLGSGVAEAIASMGACPSQFKMFGFPDQFAAVTGTRDYLNAQFGLDVESMADQIIRHLS